MFKLCTTIVNEQIFFNVTWIRIFLTASDMMIIMNGMNDDKTFTIHISQLGINSNILKVRDTLWSLLNNNNVKGLIGA